MTAIYRAREAFAFTDKRGVPRVVNAGDLIAADDPSLKGKIHLFEQVELAAARASGVEEATAEPGSRRSLSTKGQTRHREPTEPPAIKAEGSSSDA